LNKIESEYVKSGRDIYFFENPRFAEVDIKAAKKKFDEWKNLIEINSVHIQDVVDRQEELHNELLKLSDEAILREAYFFFTYKTDQLFCQIRKTTEKFTEYLKKKLEEIEG